MSKSITESAAEILNASLASRKDDPMVSGGAQVVDLGGQTPTTDPSAIGVEAAKQAKEAPKPGTQGAPAEGAKKTVATVNKTEEEQTNPVKEETDEDEDLPELTEEELEEFLASLSEEELNDFLTSLEEEETDEETDETTETIAEGETETTEEETPALTEEEIAEARKAALKDMVSKNMTSCKEDVDALFNGEALSEDFKTKATTIFEAAVRSRVEAIVEEISKENEEALTATVSQIEEELSDKIDEYLNYVVEQWMEENKLAIETGLRAEIAEDFMAGLKNLFVEHYIEVPEEKADLVEELAANVADRDEKLAEQEKRISELTKALNESRAQEILRKICEGLTEVQVAKIKSLAEGVEFTTEGEYSQKLAVIRESYFKAGKPKSEAPQSLVETDGKEVTDTMDYYVKAISKQLPK